MNRGRPPRLFAFCSCVQCGSYNIVLNVYHNETIWRRDDAAGLIGGPAVLQNAHCGAGNGPGVKNYSRTRTQRRGTKNYASCGLLDAL